MSETSKFTPKYSDIRIENGELKFVLSGDSDYGLDKSITNAIRRTLLTDIPTVGFKLTQNGENNDLIMVTNESSLHNEMLLHRISFIPLHLEPVNYMRNHLFECKVIHDGKEPFKFITMNDVQIYPLKSGFIERLEKLHDDSYDLSPDDERVLREQLSVVNIENYDLSKPLSQKEKDKIYKPFEFRGKKNYCLITELKKTHTAETYQEIHFYGSPSVGYGYEDSKFQGVSQATPTFKIDEQLVTSTLKEKIKLEGIEQEDVESYSRKFRLRESERYFYRDMDDEPNSYDFAIKSVHYYDSSKILKVSIKKPHPLEDKILFIVSLNPTHKLVVGDEITKIQNMFTYLLDGIDDLVSDLKILSKLTDKTF